VAGMITFFTIPKPFKGKTAILQRNAIQSWLKLDPHIEVILYGDDEGIIETAMELGIKHVSKIKKNDFGTPTLDFIFEQTQKYAQYDILCYVNTDIILLSDIISFVRQIKLEKFLVIGERCNISIDEPIDFNNQNWELNLKKQVISNGSSEGVMGIDFFIFPKNLALNLPPLAVGRRGWDNWLIYHARTLGTNVIDLSPSIKVIHQNHDYQHIPQKRGYKWDGPESDYNLKIIGGGASQMYCWNILDARWIFKNNKLVKKPLSLLEIYRKLILIVPTNFHPLIEHIFWLQQWIKYKKTK
jgi:hypothetical protein